MQGHKRSKEMSKSEMGLQSLGQGSWERVWNREGQVGLGTRSSKNRTKVCGWMGYAVGGLGISLGHGEVWIRVPVWCYTLCNPIPELRLYFSTSVSQGLALIPPLSHFCCKGPYVISITFLFLVPTFAPLIRFGISHVQLLRVEFQTQWGRGDTSRKAWS